MTKPQPSIQIVMRDAEDADAQRKKLIEEKWELFRSHPDRWLFRKDSLLVHNIEAEAMDLIYDPKNDIFTIDPSTIKGTGKNKVITVADVRKALGKE